MSVTIAARLDRLPVTPTILKMVTLISLGGFFEFYDIFLTAYIAPGLYKSGIFNPSSSNVFASDNIATFIAVFFAGLFISTLFLSRIADHFGRKTIFNFSLLWYSLCTIAMAFQISSPAILFFRFAAGIGIGMELVVIDTYLSELVPKTSRGRAFAFNQLLSFSAIPVVALLSFFLVPRSFWGIDGWRWVTLIGSTGAFLVFVARRNLPESPRWLEQSGRDQEADRIMRQIEGTVQHESGEKLAQHSDPTMLQSSATPQRQHTAEPDSRTACPTQPPGVFRRTGRSREDEDEDENENEGQCEFPGNLATALSQAHDHVVDLQSLSDNRLLRIRQLGAHFSNIKRDHDHKVTRVQFYHRFR